MLNWAIQPPARARPGVALYPPLVALLSSESESEREILEDLSRLWSTATLFNSTGEVLTQHLSGNAFGSAHPFPEAGGSSAATRNWAYFYFPDLVIHESGNYCVRITLMKMGYSSDTAPDEVATVCEHVDSRWISIEDGAPNRSRTSKCRAPRATKY